MKNIKFLILALSAALLVACTSATKLEWLEGNWYSSDWNVTYTIEKKNEHWLITSKNEVIANHAKQTTNSDGNVVLTADDGTQFVIEKVSKSKINFQQVAADGVVGTTASVLFEKVAD
ncbi:hypothetical protein [Streptococcus saliviloxodontae]|uniref:Lipoprotein n=1 Tax=Streptococcus saliviloxodontae TaxID=1349416 RepID=A0ABS2PMS3_9STRE|nr:hypothetical protein [Streptococcus saliviloxodontae]MBM7636739.1 hypothetical protein [Streptococcus saliviloxodontae]